MAIISKCAVMIQRDGRICDYRRTQLRSVMNNVKSMHDSLCLIAVVGTERQRVGGWLSHTQELQKRGEKKPSPYVFHLL